jgi:hypothetical protein
MRETLGQIIGPPPIDLVPGSRGNILLLSMRRVASLVGYCFQYELEDVIVEVTGADRADLSRLELVEFERRVYKALHSMAPSPSLALRLVPRLGGLHLDKTYDLFLPIFNNAYEVFALSAIPNWRKQCRYAACIVSEAVESELPEYLLESLASFDRIYISSNPVDAVERIVGHPCGYMPLSVDALGFCPYPKPPQRNIDVLGIGRRSSITHAALMALARDRGAFYYYDTIRMMTGVTDAARQVTFSVMDSAEHRFKHASLLKRSRYYLASRARANEAVGQLDELSGRFFEGAAAGTIMLGEPPRSDRYRTLFDWPEAVVDIPFDAPDIAQKIAQLDADPERCVRIRRDNMVNALLRHDCAYRLRTVFDDAGMTAPPGLLAREARLREVADMVREAPIAP